MGGLIKSFTFGRNTLKRNIGESSKATLEAIEKTQVGLDLTSLKALDNGAYNIVRDLITFTGIIERTGNVAKPTPLWEAYQRLHAQNPEDAWRWLITRSLWLYVLPNGSQVNANSFAKSSGISFNFFRSVLGLLCLLASLPEDDRFLQYGEFSEIFDDDAVWGQSSVEAFSLLLNLRKGGAKNFLNRGFIDDLEPQYSVPRDNLNTVFNKAFQQTGLFEYKQVGGKLTAIALAAGLDAVLSNRIRFILDHPVTWLGNDWSGFLQSQPIDLPQEVSLMRTEEKEEEPAPRPIIELIDVATKAFSDAGLQFDKNLLARFVSALLAKPFVILTGLSGSGKTKLAQAFSTWISPYYLYRDPLAKNNIIKSDKTSYTIVAADNVSVEVSAPDGTLTALPRILISEWVNVIETLSLTREASARSIRDEVGKTTKYSSQINSFESQLKSLAFAIYEGTSSLPTPKHFEVIPVNADWVSKENILGYPDALNPGKYVRVTPALDLMIKAKNDPSRPYFLILDEMNLSHVERYFSDFLSALESGETITLHGGTSEIDGIPPFIKIPKNLFVIGTVNVDETTYTFSPKVLDRANSIEFRIEKAAFASYLSDGAPLNLSLLDGQGQAYAKNFVLAALHEYAIPSQKKRVNAEIDLLFNALTPYGREFGFRTAKEISRFVYYYDSLLGGAASIEDAIDAQIYQKVLPKLNGSRRRLEPVLCALAQLCYMGRNWDMAQQELLNTTELIVAASRAASLEDNDLHPILNKVAYSGLPTYRLSFNKIVQMLDRLMAEGFASFAEA